MLNEAKARRDWYFLVATNRVVKLGVVEMTRLRKTGGETTLAGNKLWSLGENRFLSTYEAINGTSGIDIFGQILDANLNPNSAPRALAFEQLDERVTSVASFADGSFLISMYKQPIGAQSSETLFVQRFDAVGNALGPAYNVFNGGPRGGTEPRVIALSDGTGIVAFDTGGGVYAQHLASDGAPIGGLLLVGSLNTSATFDIAEAGAGSFVVAWSATPTFSPTTQSLIHFRFFNTDGVALTPDATLSSIVFPRQSAPDIVRLADGSFAVAFVNNSGGANFDPVTGDIYVQLIPANGTIVRGPLLVSFDTAGNQILPSIGALPDGGFVVSWSGTGGTFPGSNGFDIYAQTFNADGSYADDVSLVNTDTAAGGIGSKVLVNSSGHVVIDWQGGLGHEAQAFDPATFRIYNGNKGNNQFTAKTGEDWMISGFTGADRLTGSTGNDILRGGEGNDTLSGGAGDDVFEVEANGGFDSIAGGAGFDRILALAEGVTIGVTSISGIERISALGHAGVTISGDRANNTIDLSATELSGIAAILGGGGVDTIRGSAGADTIFGGLGADLISGGGGTDTFRGTLAELDGDTIFDFSSFEKIVVTAFTASDRSVYSLANGVLTLDPDGAGGQPGAQILLPGVPDGAGLSISAGADVLTIQIFP